MDDPVLTSRLDALRNNLRMVAGNLDSKVWQPEGNRVHTRTELLGESSLWTGLQVLVTAINGHVRRLDEVEAKLQAAKDEADTTSAWVNYGNRLRDSEDLLRECLEIIGSLAIRNSDLDAQLLYVADELIRDCLTLAISDSNYYLLVHGVTFSEAFSKTRARIIRLRFPAWTIWNLPLAAHELGHVANQHVVDEELKQPDDLRDLTPFMAKQRDVLIASDAELNQEAQAGGERARKAGLSADSRLRILLADAFATFIMGPAYACSAIMLRLNPAAEVPHDVPRDIHRAFVILAMLRWMNANAPGLGGPYNNVLGRLDSDWRNAIDRSSPAKKLIAAEEAFLQQLVEGFAQGVCRTSFTAGAMYPYASNRGDGWARASEWANEWLKQKGDHNPLTIPKDASGKLRDVLNAAWSCRLVIKGDVDARKVAHKELADVATSLCRALIPSRVKSAQIPTPTPTAPVS